MKTKGTCKECGRENIRTLANGTLARHKARGQYAFCIGFLAVPGTVAQVPAAPLLNGQINCPNCEGSGWTIAGWAQRDPQSNPFAGDCEHCNGTGAIPGGK